MADWEDAVQEAADWALERLAEGLRDQAAQAAEHGKQELADLLRDTATDVDERR